MTAKTSLQAYFPLSIQISDQAWQRLDLSDRLRPFHQAPLMLRLRVVADCINAPAHRQVVSAGELHLAALLNRAFRHLLQSYFSGRGCRVERDQIWIAGRPLSNPRLLKALEDFVALFPPAEVRDGQTKAEDYLSVLPNRLAGLGELFILAVQNANPALAEMRPLFDDAELARRTAYRQALSELDHELGDASASGLLRRSLLDLLEEPIRQSPHSLHGQLRLVKELWHEHLPEDLQNAILTAFDISAEETHMRGFGPGPTRVLDFRREAARIDDYYPEPEAFTADADWMSNVVLIAKSTYVWLDQLSKRYGRPITRVDQIPDTELDRLARWGFNSLWLIGIWERSQVSQWIKHMRGNPEALASAYSLYDYVIAADLGGEEAMADLEERCRQRGIRLASDIVPNHTGLYSRWLKEHPDWYVQLEHPPFPSYRFSGRDLSPDAEISIQIEDGYYDHSDAAVVFKYSDHRDGRVRYIYHGNDGTHMPWNDTAQLNYLLPEVREAMIGTILHIARRFKVIRFDAAMTLAKKHFQRLWFPQPGGGAGVPSRAEHSMTREEFERAFPKEFWREVVDRVAAEVPDTLLIAEAFWLMEGYFVRTLGMHRVYNSAFMNMLKNEENAKYRQTIKNILEFNHEILKRFTNFMNNPDEATAVEQFGKGEKYYGVATMLATMPGLPMFGHGQIEGLSEKYGMEYSKAYWDEAIDEGMVSEHERRIFPLLRKRYLFSGSENFRLYDFWAEHGVDENVFAYSNRWGDEKALVVFHNCYAETSGWIRTSAAWASAPSEEPSWLEQTTLGQALDLHAQDDVFYRLREHPSGLEYLLRGRELVEQGLRVHLQGYECRAFLGFEELRDTQGIWEQVYLDLNGQPCADLDRAWGRRHYAELITATGEILSAKNLRHWASLMLSEKNKIKTNKDFIDFSTRLSYFWQKTMHDGSLDKTEPQLAAALDEDLAAVRRLLSLRSRKSKERNALAWLNTGLPREKDAKKAQVAVTADLSGPLAGQEYRILVPWLLWHRLTKENPQRSAGQLVEECLLDEVLCRAVQGAPEPPFNLNLDQARAETRLLVLLLDQPPVLTPKELRQTLAEFLQNLAAREYLGCNLYQGIEWFNRERYENLVYWLCMLGALHHASGEDTDQKLLDALTALHGEARRVLEQAHDAGYQVEALRRHLAEKTQDTRAG
ncbi:alpha-amylase family glycosyl hydrolase [Geoalkalibacter halelectricus]|uniref:alpha-amylase family glycosyl hydrolase n=1 Tax=Geoalkalibacter halelectricus TaxID=2847045 RepID=UPI00266F0401|nr:alpha-amylase family glycosyl hydrolase [Geoalkalibacter halelectricus]MDO3377589.1 alpha-amylase family glycosyl hydrolase [Geoalkalibacter halelectricus]